VLLVALLSSQAQSFGVVPPPELLHQNLNDMSNALLTSYEYALKTDPLRTQVATGATLAVAGDAIAQRASGSKKYDTKRAVSFASFDACWRAVQHFSYPPMIALCQGNVLGALLPNEQGIVAAALEQALVSQIIFIPLLYYPFFYAITGFVQGLTVGETVDRAKNSFWPLMRRNWLFWIPVQFCVFVAVPENAQISVLIAAGLLWTVILSASAGAATTPVVAKDNYLQLLPTTMEEEDLSDFLPEKEMQRNFPSATNAADGSLARRRSDNRSERIEQQQQQLVELNVTAT